MGLPVLERRTPAWWDASLTCLFWGAVVYACSLTLADPDLWGHLRFGQDFWAAGRVIRTDPYSYLTAGRLWITVKVKAIAVGQRGHPGQGEVRVLPDDLVMIVGIAVILEQVASAG